MYLFLFLTAGDAVTSLAKDLQIELVFLPPYSPNLNLIERIWKFTKGKLRIKYYSDFESFKNTIDTIIKQTDTVFKGQVCRLIGEKIQLFDDMELVCENTYSAPKQANNQAA